MPDQITPSAGNIGTLIAIKNLFYNIPLRKKAMKNTSEEYNRILDVIQRYSVHYTGVSFICKRVIFIYLVWF